MKTSKGYRHPSAPPLNLTDEEIEAIARILHILGDIKDRRRGITVAAMAIKIAYMEADNPRWQPIRYACGLDVLPDGGQWT
jgi:hypothetical protein